MYKNKRIVIKIGSNVITSVDGTLDVAHLENLVDQIAALRKHSIEVIIVSSGAVAAGRSILKLDKKLSTVSSRQLFSAIGQAKLINHYYDLFAKHNLICGQVLTTKESLGTRASYLTQRDCINIMLENGVIPIINENDTISLTELMFTDNDELSGLLAAMTQSKALFILSNIDGIYNGSPNDPDSEVIRNIQPKQDLTQYIQTTKSTFGRGGMLTKCNIALKVAEEGIDVFIANGKRNDILIDLVRDNKSEIPCTHFTKSEKPISDVKKWLAHSESFAKGIAYINADAQTALTGDKATSLLLVGVTKIEGTFQKGDIIAIYNQDNIEIGVGQTQYDSEIAVKNIGIKEIKPLIQYDYLYLNNI